MSFSKITSKGQITIPSAVRTRLNLKPGDRVEFRVGADASTVYFVPSKNKTEDVFGILSSKVKKPMSIEDMDEGIKNHLRKRFK